MAGLSEQSVFTCIESLDKGTSVKNKYLNGQNYKTNLAIELIARYQSVVTNLRFIRSCMEIGYGFSRFGRYAYDIVDVPETIGPIPDCDKTPVLQMAKIVR
jgi:phosphate transport system protein